MWRGWGLTQLDLLPGLERHLYPDSLLSLPGAFPVPGIPGGAAVLTSPSLLSPQAASEAYLLTLR